MRGDSSTQPNGVHPGGWVAFNLWELIWAARTNYGVCVCAGGEGTEDVWREEGRARRGGGTRAFNEYMSIYSESTKCCLGLFS